MIRIKKDFNKIPEALQSPLTKKRRKELIKKGSYIYKSIYNSRYKMKDIKDALIKIEGLKEDFKKDASDPKNQFLAFRRYIVKNFI